MSSVTEFLDGAVEALQAAHRAQRYGAAPTHMEFYAWGWGLSTMAAELSGVAVLLERQVEQYSQEWELRDDCGMDPAQRIASCVALLTDLAAVFGTASSIARAYHNEMGHVAVDDDGWEEVN